MTGHSFWAIWQRSEPPTLPPPPKRLKALRNGGCGDAAAISRFGETAFMRGELDKAALPEAFVRIATAAYASERLEQARGLLAPYQTAGEPAVRSAAKIAFAFILIRHRGMNGDVQGEIEHLLQNDSALAGNADRYYLLATIAMARRDWPQAGQFATEALEIAPEYYNAQVIWSLAQLEQLGRQSGMLSHCARAIHTFERALAPLLALGACPTHVAHFDLAASRFLSPPSDDEEGLTLIRRILLAYVSQNDEVGRSLVQLYAKNHTKCVRELGALFDQTG